MHQEQTKEDQQGAKPPEKRELLCKQSLPKDGREEKIRSGVGDHRLQRRRAKPQSLGEYRPHHGITGNHQSEENNPNHGDEIFAEVMRRDLGKPI